MSKYDTYNREERNLCSHLFKLLHEKLDEKQSSPLGMFLRRLSNKNLSFRNYKSGLRKINFNNIGIYSEVAIIRDAFFVISKKNEEIVYRFMDELIKIICHQERSYNCRLFSQLPSILNSPIKTHPRQIRQKASLKGINLIRDEQKVYGAIQAMFNAKPDLAITIDDKLLVFEAKFTEPFNSIQFERTWNIAEVWTKMLYNDFGFKSPPEYTVIKIGAARFNPEISWTEILEIAENYYLENDRTRIAFRSAVNILNANDGP